MDEIKEMSPAGLQFLMDNEGCVLTHYKDVKGIWTVGVGNTYLEDGSKVTEQTPPITEKRAVELFKSVLRAFELTVYSNTRDDINQNQFDSLVSLTYNIGQQAFKDSTLVRKINERASDQEIKDAFMLWRKPKEIIGRRKKEVALYFKK